MKKTLLLSLAMICVASMAFGQAGTVGIYADPVGANCHLPDVVAGLNVYNVVHTNTAGASAVQFSAPLPGCYVAGLWLSDAPFYGVTLGNSQVGVAIGYGACVGAPNIVLLINIFGQGLTGPCCAWTVVPDPNVPSGQIEVVDCGNNLIFGNGFTSYVNGNSNDCPCTVATEESTWGQVKSLYSAE